MEADYTAAKAGLIAMHASVTAELPRDSGVRTLLVTTGQVSTSLFAGVETPSSFWGPMLEPVDVAKEVIAAIDSGANGHLAMPLYARWIQLLAVLPVGLQTMLRAASGMDKAMERGYIGRSARRKP
jgi:short-subunit dehydrogenase